MADSSLLWSAAYAPVKAALWQRAKAPPRVGVGVGVRVRVRARVRARARARVRARVRVAPPWLLRQPLSSVRA